jgi:hypothetical protein
MSNAGPEGLLRIRSKIERANRHIDDLDAACRSFQGSDSYGVSPKPAANGGERVYSVDFVRDVPTGIPLIAGDAIHNLRSALDYLAMQLILAGPSGGDRSLDSEVFFPITDSAQGLDKRLKKLRGTGPGGIFGGGVEDAIRACEPYSGGKGGDLWVLHELNIRDKHRLLITAALGFRDGAMIPEFRFAGPDFLFKVGGKSFPLKQGDVLLRVRDLEIRQDPRFGIAVAFGESGVVDGEPAVPTLRHLSRRVGEVVDQFAGFL